MTNDFQYQASKVIFVATVHKKLNWRDKNKDLLVRSKTIRYFFCYIVNQSTRRIITVIKAFIRLRRTLASKFVSVEIYWELNSLVILIRGDGIKEATVTHCITGSVLSQYII